MCPIHCKMLMNAPCNWIGVSKSVSISTDHIHVNAIKDMLLSVIRTMLVRVSQT